VPNGVVQTSIAQALHRVDVSRRERLPDAVPYEASNRFAAQHAADGTNVSEGLRGNLACELLVDALVHHGVHCAHDE
jgi:hypothetical protein